MKQYIGTKLVKAEPAWNMNGEVIPKCFYTDPFAVQHGAKDGYKVCYPDGYESWSPRDVFERTYLPLTSNPKLKPDQPSIGPGMVDAFIDKVEVQTMGEKTTVVRAVLKNGFEIVESSACVSPENYSEELGREICLNKIKDKVWELLGFLLQTAVNGITGNSGNGTE